MSWFKRELAGKLLGSLLQKAATGAYGPIAKKAYWLTAGYKTQIAFVLGFPSAGIQLVAWLQANGWCEALKMPCGAWIAPGGWATWLSSAVLWLAGAFAFLGQVDGALRLDPPVAEK